jgi:Spy/CpxP family protein refolding chaperone
MKFQKNLRTITVAAALATALTLGAGAAFSQPAGPHGPGHHHPGAPDEMIGHLIANAKAQLNLNTSQQVMFDAAVASSKAARESGRALHGTVKNALTAELAKTEPDLAAVAAVADNARAQGQALRNSVRGQWLALYATFSVDQKAVVKNILVQKMAEGASFRQKMMQRFHGPAAGTTN